MEMYINMSVNPGGRAWTDLTVWRGGFTPDELLSVEIVPQDFPFLCLCITGRTVQVVHARNTTILLVEMVVKVSPVVQHREDVGDPSRRSALTRAQLLTRGKPDRLHLLAAPPTIEILHAQHWQGWALPGS